MPVVLSVFLYLSYYLIDNFSTKMARQAVWTVWEGVWLGSAFLGSLGALFTVKAVNDSVMIDPDSWRVFLTRWLGKRENRHYQPKEVVMTPPDYRRDLQLIEQWNKQSANLLHHFTTHPLLITILHSPRADARLNRLITDLETLIDDLLNASEAILIAKLMDYPLIRPLNLRLFNHPILRWSLLILFPIGLIVYGIIAWQRRQIYIDLATAQKVNNELLIELQAILTPNPQ
jgi:lipopolysaccharide export system permease protein